MKNVNIKYKGLCPNDLYGNYCNIGKFVEWLAENKYNIEDLIKFSKQISNLKGS